jgi:hypothetical protein
VVWKGAKVEQTYTLEVDGRFAREGVLNEKEGKHR